MEREGKAACFSFLFRVCVCVQLTTERFDYLEHARRIGKGKGRHSRVEMKTGTATWERKEMEKVDVFAIVFCY